MSGVRRVHTALAFLFAASMLPYAIITGDGIAPTLVMFIGLCTTTVWAWMDRD